MIEPRSLLSNIETQAHTLGFQYTFWSYLQIFECSIGIKHVLRFFECSIATYPLVSNKKFVHISCPPILLMFDWFIPPDLLQFQYTFWFPEQSKNRDQEHSILKDEKKNMRCERFMAWSNNCYLLVDLQNKYVLSPCLSNPIKTS